MTHLFGRPVVLVMRVGLAIRDDHVETMFRLGLAVHLLTEDSGALADPRFASVRLLAPTLTADALTDEIVTALRETGGEFAVTFYETDIVAVGRANRRHGVAWSRPDADGTARDKSRQRAHLAAHGLPSPLSIGVGDVRVDAGVFARVGLPCIVKPTHGAGSALVELVADPARAGTLLAEIRELTTTGEEHFYDGTPATWALIEEYLPGEEVTCDGVVIDGEFFLGGVHSKVLPNPPWFDEDLYTLPYGDPGTEAELSRVMSELAATLELDVALVNAELRRGADGAFRIVEFSTRISGGHVYRNIRDAHAVDLVELFLRDAAGDRDRARAQARQRHPGRVATCVKFVYRTGVVAANSAGRARTSPHFRQYYPVAGPGERVAGAPYGFDPCGLLSVWGPYDPAEHPVAIHRAAADCADLLHLDVRP